MKKRSDQYQYVGFNDKPFIIASIPILGLIIPLLFFTDTVEWTFWGFLPSFVVSMIHAAAYWILIRNASIWVRKKWPDQADTKKRLVYTAVSVVIIFLVVDNGLGFLENYCLPKHNGPKDITVAFASIFIIILCLSIYEGFFLNYKWKMALIEREQLERENIESQLEGLRNQVNPHFLFNSLNTLAYIIPEDPDKGVKFVQKLSKVYRYILEIRDKKLISVREELDFLNAYCFLLKQRFGENLDIQIKVPETAYSEMVIPLSMQMLFENAIKHNIISSSQPLTIHVSLKDNMLQVSNNLQRKQQELPSTSVGLQNIRNRYSFFTSEKVEVDENSQHFLVKLPLINSPKQILA